MNTAASDRMKAPLREQVGCSPADRPSLWRDWLRANKIRRRVVHRGARVSEADARKVVEAVEAIIRYVEESKRSWSVLRADEKRNAVSLGAAFRWRAGAQ